MSEATMFEAVFSVAYFAAALTVITLTAMSLRKKLAIKLTGKFSAKDARSQAFCLWLGFIVVSFLSPLEDYAREALLYVLAAGGGLLLGWRVGGSLSAQYEPDRDSSEKGGAA
ncbi:MAG: hypothetical protein LBL86_07285 [Coriobacteriales bacterium]|jgi:hypothetical protein|nr:hypothetical protein [Coriobacteriales bacterium]